MLTDKIHIYHPSPAPSSSQAEENDADNVLADSLTSIFRDAEDNQHGTPGAHIVYRSNRFGDITLTLANPEEEKSRKLFAHYLWNAELYVAEKISIADQRSVWSVNEHRVLELGAGLGLCGIVSALAGAAHIVVSDYPEPTVLKNIKRNINTNLSSERMNKPVVESHIWGAFDDALSRSQKHQYSRIIVADCLWMPEQHHNLATSIHYFLELNADACAFVVAGFHSGRERMAPFFRIIEQNHLRVDDIFEVDVEGETRTWQSDRGTENVLERKRWLAVCVLRHKDA